MTAWLDVCGAATTPSEAIRIFLVGKPRSVGVKVARVILQCEFADYTVKHASQGL